MDDVHRYGLNTFSCAWTLTFPYWHLHTNTHIHRNACMCLNMQTHVVQPCGRAWTWRRVTLCGLALVSVPLWASVFLLCKMGFVRPGPSLVVVRME